MGTLPVGAGLPGKLLFRPERNLHRTPGSELIQLSAQQMKRILVCGGTQSTQKQNGSDKPEYGRYMIRLRLNIRVRDQKLPEAWIQAGRQHKSQSNAIFAMGCYTRLDSNLEFGWAYW